MPTPPAAPVPGDRLRERRGLFALLSVATVFEGFDTKLAGLVLPVIGREFGADRELLGGVLGLSSTGMMAAFAIIRLADRVGRRPVFLVSLAGYCAFSLATGFATSLAAFTVLQLLARMFMVVELALAYVILSEELAPGERGRANGLLGGCATVGAAIPALLLAPLEGLGPGWRGLFAVGAVPLLLLPLYVRAVPETRLFARRAAPPPSWRDEWRAFAAFLGPATRRRFAGVTALWFTVNFWSGSALGFFTLFAFEERGWTAADLQWLPLGTLPLGFLGYWGCGLAMDRIGRRPTAVAYLAGAFAATALCFQLDHPAATYGGWFLLAGLGGLWTIAATWTAELFPTELRATALGVTNNLLGRTGLIAGPLVTGPLAERWDSTADAVTALAVLPLLCIPVVWWSLPETRGTPLDA